MQRIRRGSQSLRWPIYDSGYIWDVVIVSVSYTAANGCANSSSSVYTALRKCGDVNVRHHEGYSTFRRKLQISTMCCEEFDSPAKNMHIRLGLAQLISNVSCHGQGSAERSVGGNTASIALAMLGCEISLVITRGRSRLRSQQSHQSGQFFFHLLLELLQGDSRSLRK